MPRISEHARLIMIMRLAVAWQMRLCVLQKMKDIIDTMQNMLDLVFLNRLELIEATRYLYRSKYRKREFDVFAINVPEDSIPPSVANSISDYPRRNL